MSYVHSSTAEAMAAVREALQAAEDLSEKLKQAKQRYSDQVAATIEKDLNNQYSTACMNAKYALERARRASLDRVDQAVSSALSIGDAEEDFKLLALPVNLSANELHTLLARHPDNMLFARAVAQYAKDHGHEDRSLLAMAADHIDASAEKSSINGMYDILLKYVADVPLAVAAQKADIRVFEQMEAEGCFDKL